MVTVGVLAAIVNVFVLLIVAISDRAIELIVRNFAASRLQHSHRAPVVHDSDTWLPNIPRSVVKYYRHPAILLTVLCTVFLIAAELISEIGVDVHDKCSPEKKTGVVISPGDSSGTFTKVELGGIALLIQYTKFLDGNLTHVPAGIPKALTGKECIECLEGKKHRDIMRGCRVKPGRTYKPGEMAVTIARTNGPFGTIAKSFLDKQTGERYKAETTGDLTGNGKHRGAFIFWDNNIGEEEGRKILSYFEYGKQSHLNALKKKTSDKFLEAGGVEVPIEEDTEANVYTFNIECEVNELSFDRFNEAVMVYRTMQMENPTSPETVHFNETTVQFQPLEPKDINKAALAVKVTDDDDTMGEYFMYTTCGVYRWKYILPIVGCIIIILSLGLISMAIAPQTVIEGIPYNSRSWFRFAQDGDKHGAKEKGGANVSGYFDAVFEEMVLVSDTPGANPQVQFRSRARSTIPDGAGRHEGSHAETFDEPFDEPRS